jgi:hypothetical protein
MYNLNELYENVNTHFNPEMTVDEKEMLDGIRGAAYQQTQALLPNHYKWLDNWAKKPSCGHQVDMA